MALLHVHFFSKVLELATSMDILLPETPCPYANGKWPTLYLLHGLSDDHTVWQRQTSIERYVANRGLAVVMPTVHRSFYTDMRHGGKYWTFISEEVPVLCERMFPLSTARKDRFAAGLSMGGYGALKLGLRCPDRFAGVASLSGAVDMMALYRADKQADKSFFWDIFGSVEASQVQGDDLVTVADALIQSGKEMPHIYMACGTEDFLYENNKGFLNRFKKTLAITYEEGPGAHTWDFWDRYIQRVLDWLPVQLRNENE